MKDRIYLVFDRTKSSLKIRKFLIRKIQTTTLKKSNIIIVLGGDGFMLQTLKKLYKFKKPFYGINSGNYGFLMNKFSNENFLKNLKTLHSIKIYPLQMTVKTKNDQIKRFLILREFFVLSKTR